MSDHDKQDGKNRDQPRAGGSRTFDESGKLIKGPKPGKGSSAKPKPASGNSGGTTAEAEGDK